VLPRLAWHKLAAWRAAGASGKLDSIKEYGAQDFFGQIDELRIWRTARTQDQIRQVGLPALWHIALVCLLQLPEWHLQCLHSQV
jgi:hypothetical protein